MSRTDPRLMHASCVTFDGDGVLITGPSGAGKSDLALRLIDTAGRATGCAEMKAQLVGDDQLLVWSEDGQVLVKPAPELEGLIEIRGLGIVASAFTPESRVCLVVELRGRADIERMPRKEDMSRPLCGINVPCIVVDSAAASAAARVRSGLLAALTQSGDRQG